MFQAINALQTIYITYSLHTAIKKELQFKTELTSNKLHSLILCMVHYLKVQDDLIQQRGILKNFTKFYKKISEIHSTALYYLLDLYAQNLYIFELEELMILLYHKKLLTAVIPATLLRINYKEAPTIFRRFKTFLKNLIESPKDLFLVYGHITLTVLDMIKKRAGLFGCDENSNRLQILVPLKQNFKFGKDENL